MIKKTIASVILACCTLVAPQVALAEDDPPTDDSANQAEDGHDQVEGTTEPGNTDEDRVIFDDGIPSTPVPILEEVESPHSVVPEGASGASSTSTYRLNHYASLVPQPQGYATNSCWKRVLSSSANFYMCRRVRSTVVTIAKNDPTIIASSAHDATHGTMVVHRNGAYEGCLTYYSYYWRCSYTADQHWGRQTSTNLASNYYYRAFKEVNLVPKLKCAWEVNKVWRGRITTATGNNLAKNCISGVFG